MAMFEKCLRLIVCFSNRFVLPIHLHPIPNYCVHAVVGVRGGGLVGEAEVLFFNLDSSLNDIGQIYHSIDIIIIDMLEMYGLSIEI